MNFLAHIALSGSNKDLMIGNFIADSIRRVEFKEFEDKVIEGVELHHKIDEFTDSHPIVEESKVRLREKHAKYSGVIVDILYDHFLARDFEKYHHQNLELFASNFYSFMNSRNEEMPLAIQRMLPYMIEHNWLVAYSNFEGLQKVFNGMSRRASFDNRMIEAVDDLRLDYSLFEEEFTQFYPSLQEYVKSQI